MIHIVDMQAGNYKEIIEIWNPVVTTSKTGAKTTTYEFNRTTRASVIWKNGNRLVGDGEIFYDLSRTFVVRSYVKIDNFDRIKFDGKFYRIVNIDHRKDYNDIQIMAELVND